MRRFGLALARDDRFVCDDASAAALVDKLFRQASLTLIDDAGGDARSARVRAFAQFIRLYRRHVRGLAAEDADGGWAEGPQPAGRANASVTAGVRNLPLELRETLLLVVLARRFPYRSGAGARYSPGRRHRSPRPRARAHVRAYGRGARIGGEGRAWPNAAHLRIVK